MGNQIETLHPQDQVCCGILHTMDLLCKEPCIFTISVIYFYIYRALHNQPVLLLGKVCLDTFQLMQLK